MALYVYSTLLKAQQNISKHLNTLFLATKVFHQKSSIFPFFLYLVLCQISSLQPFRPFSNHQIPGI